MNSIQEGLKELFEQSNDILDNRKLNYYRSEIARITFNQPLISSTGLFHIYNVSERDADRIIDRLKRLDFIERVSKSPSGKFNFDNFMPGKLPERYFEVTGQIKEK